VSTKVAIFGGSFNPPHVAHVLAVAYVLSTADVDRLMLVPTFKHPFGKPLAPFDDRVRMCELAMAPLPSVEVSRIEERLDGASLTLHTLEAIKQEHPDWDLRLVMGADLLIEADKWFRFEEVRKLAPPIVLGRAGFEQAGAPPPILPAISSTRIRELIARGRWMELAALLPRHVMEHVRARGLYAAT